MKKTFFLLTLLITIFISCRKNTDNSNTFPAETNEGRNTLGCYIDGTAFIAATTLFGLVSPLNVSYYRDSTSIYKAGFLSIGGIDARYQDNIAGNLVINKHNVFGVGEYNLVHVNNCASTYGCDGIGYYNAKTGKTYFAESGKLTITKLDTLQRVVSGTFSFMAKDTLGNIKHITRGRFDAKYFRP